MFVFFLSGTFVRFSSSARPILFFLLRLCQQDICLQQRFTFFNQLEQSWVHASSIKLGRFPPGTYPQQRNSVRNQ